MLPIEKVIAWHHAHQRDLPWRTNKTPYRVWLSEILLQQTQVTAVLSYYARFLERFPTIGSLAKASEDEVLALWSGLGYYSRGRNLHRSAQIICDQLDGEFPTNFEDILKLPGIGKYTAGAISCFAFNKPAAVVDGNVARVLARFFNDQTTIDTQAGKKHFETISLALAQKASDCAALQEGIMEIGATLCKPQNPACDQCPLQEGCQSWTLKNWATLPQKSPKRPRTSLVLACLIVRRQNQILLQRQNKKGLFGGLYEPPNRPVHANGSALETARELARAFNLPATGVKESVVVERTLTHRNLTLHGFVLDAAESEKSGQWISLDQLHQVGLSSAMKTLLLKMVSL